MDPAVKPRGVAKKAMGCTLGRAAKNRTAPSLSAPDRAGPILPAMTPDAQTALDAGVRYAHALLRQVRGALAPWMRRAERTAARRSLRLAEHFLRRAILLLSFTLDQSLGPVRPVRQQTRTSEAARKPIRLAQLQLAEPQTILRKRIVRSLPVGVFDDLDPDEYLPAGHLTKRFARIETALARLPAAARRLALWRRRMRGTRRNPLRSRLILPRPKDAETRHFALWLDWIDRAARDGLHPAPG